MTKPFNPLTDRRKPQAKSVQNSIEMTAADASSPPLSPISGRPMERAFCRDVPVWCDPDNRLVLPVKKVS